MGTDQLQHGKRYNLAGIQLLRGVAALAVLIHHILEESTVLLPTNFLPDAVILLGASGVDLFFVISGFIMHYTMHGRFGMPGATSDFIVRRVIRIVPLYWLCTLFIATVAATGLAYKKMVLGPDNLFTSLFFIPSDNLILGVGWTLQYEMYFYILFALCLAFATARAAIFLVPGVLCSMMIAGQIFPTGPLRDFLTNPIALEFAFGLCLAHLFISGRLPRFDPLIPALIGVSLLVTTSALLPADGTAGLARSVRFLAWGMPAALIVLAVLLMDRIEGPAGRALYLIGDASYSIYLTHAIVMTSYARLIKNESLASFMPALGWMTAAAATALAVGLGSYFLIERPANDWLRRWTARNSAVSVNSA